MGTNRDEGTLFTYPLYATGGINTEQKYKTWLNSTFFSEYEVGSTTKYTDEGFAQLLQRYPADPASGYAANMAQASAAIRDASFYCGTSYAAQSLADGPVNIHTGPTTRTCSRTLVGKAAQAPLETAPCWQHADVVLADADACL